MAKALAFVGLPLAAGHGQMMHPPNWFMTNGLPRMCPMKRGADWGIGAYWYTNYTFAEKTTMDDDDLRRTFTDYSNYPGWGPGQYSPRNPWRYPGNAKVDSPCGGYGGNMHGCQHADGTPAGCVMGGTAFGPDALDEYNKGKLGKNIKRTRWQKGSVVEAAYIMYSNHAGGYSYRLCKQSPNMTEECFQAGHLDFVGDTHIIQWGPDKSTRKEIPAVYTTNGTYPAGSMWARGPIPTCAGANGGFALSLLGLAAIDCEPYPWVPENRRETQFPPALPGLYGWGTDYSHKRNHYMPYFIIDRLQVPSNLPTGHYVLGWRWDVEQGAQVWTTCADIEIVTDSVDEKEWAAWDDDCGVKPTPTPPPTPTPSPTPTPTPTPTPSGFCTISEGMNNNGHNMRQASGVKSTADCCSKCVDTEGCIGFTFVKGAFLHPAQCWLKDAVDDLVPDSAVDSGVVDARALLV